MLQNVGQLHSCERLLGSKSSKMTQADNTVDKEELRKRLTPLQYHVTQEKGTERYNYDVDS